MEAAIDMAIDMVGGADGFRTGGASRAGRGSLPSGVSLREARTAERLALARGLLRRAEERSTGRRAAVPVEAPAAGDLADGPARAVDGALPVAATLAGLFPGGGLRRGSTVAVGAGPGSTSLLLGLLAEASTSGAWIGVVGRPELGLVAAAETGLRLERLALVPHPGADLVAVTAALLDGLDVVVVAGAQRAGVRAADRQRLAARARQRGAVLVPLGRWPGADVELTCTDSRWEGLAAGFGRLRTRRAEVRLRGRGLPPAGRGTTLLLPGPGGAIAPVGTEEGEPRDAWWSRQVCAAGERGSSARVREAG